MTAKPKPKVTKLDLRKRLKPFYSPSPGEVEVVDVPEMAFLMVDGVGAPESGGFQEAIQTLYGLSYTTKFALKKSRNVDYPVMALEGLWWTGSGAAFDPLARDRWHWTLMMAQPDLVTAADIKASSDALAKKGRDLRPYRLERFREGLSAQTMHVGPYSTEPATIARIQSYVEANGYVPNGKHHEVYLGDPRRAAPSKLKTIVRWPVKRA